MKANMGGLDRTIRIIIAITIGILYWQKLIEGILAYILLAFAAILVLTSLVSYCPLYPLFKLNTREKQ